MTRREEGRRRREIDPAGGGPRAGAEEEDQEEKGAVDAGAIEKVGQREEGKDEPVGSRWCQRMALKKEAGSRREVRGAERGEEHTEARRWSE